MNGIAKAIDGMIATVAPQFALKRAGARQKLQILNSGYGNYGANVDTKIHLLYTSGKQKSIVLWSRTDSLCYL